MKRLTIIYAYYDNPLMFTWQQLEWAGYPPERLKQINFIVVDDASPNSPAIEYHWPNEKMDLRIYRILNDIPWNQDGARNLGVSESTTKWLFMSDMDHVLTPHAAVVVLNLLDSLKDDLFYTFARVNQSDQKPYKDHPNSYLMTRELYDRVGGYDETFAGHYGTDGNFRRALLHHSAGHVRLPISLIRFSRDDVPDASTTSLDRKKDRDKRVGLEQRRQNAYNLKHGVRPKTLLQPWGRQI